MFKERIVLPTLVGLTVAALVVGAYFVSGSQVSITGTVRPSLDLQSLSGRPTRLSVPFLQRHILIFFTPSCPSCRAVMRHYSKLASHDPFLPCFGISFGSHAETDSFARSAGVSFPVLLDTKKRVQTMLRVQRVPLVLFIDERDVVRFVLEGSRTFQEDSIYFARFGRAGAPGAPVVGSQEGTDYRLLPDAHTALLTTYPAPSACLAEGMNVRIGPVSPRFVCGADNPPGGLPQAAGPFMTRSFSRKEEPPCVPRLQG